MAAQHVTERSEEQDAARRTLKRRGILAAAATAVAGIMVKQTAQPVAAAATMLFADTTTTVTNTAAGQTQLSGNFTSGIFPFNQPMLYVRNTSTAGSGLEGNAGGTGVGVYAKSATGTGVYGTSTGGNGVYGIANAAGSSSIVAGVYGTSNTTYGIIGNTTAAGYSGLTGTTATPGVAALAATALVPTAYAAYFTGKTVVEGDFYVIKNPDGSGGGKFAAVQDREGNYRGMYATEAPEPWFEDFGEAKLVNGRAEVALDPEFATLIHGETYLAFVTAHDTRHHLAVTQRTPTAFTVEADSTPTGVAKGTAIATTGETFAWRVVGKRKDIAGTRLPKVELPKIHTPDPDKLPKPPGG